MYVCMYVCVYIARGARREHALRHAEARSDVTLRTVSLAVNLLDTHVLRCATSRNAERWANYRFTSCGVRQIVTGAYCVEHTNCFHVLVRGVNWGSALALARLDALPAAADSIEHQQIKGMIVTLQL